MAKAISIGNQNFEQLRRNHCFYVDKTNFIREWWENQDTVTLITRPRRFGKTLTMDMVEKFFSVRYTGRGDLFQGLSIWKDDDYQKLQGTYPVIFLSFAGIKGTTYEAIREGIIQIIINLYTEYHFLLQGDALTSAEKEYFHFITPDMSDAVAAMSLQRLSICMERYYGKKVIILLDEYDTPLQEAYIHDYWDNLTSFIRSLLHMTFKTNPSLERAILTGITRISKESIFSDLNNLVVVTTTSESYQDSFGFTEEEVFAALDEYGLSNKKQEIKEWYDGFIFGSQPDIYNPWSIVNYLKTGKIDTYWANTSSNALVGKLLQESNADVKKDFEALLQGETLVTEIDEQIVFNQLLTDRSAIWSLLLASGYLKVIQVEFIDLADKWLYSLVLTNREVRVMFTRMIRNWFTVSGSHYNEFIKALLLNDVKAMNQYMNEIALTSFSYFDTGKGTSRAEPERFYHGFVLGLIAELSDRYLLTSNRESGFGRYDIVLEPRKHNSEKNAFIIEFKVQDSSQEETLAETVQAALEQIKQKQYAAGLIAKGIQKEHIRQYGFAFCGKTVLIG